MNNKGMESREILSQNTCRLNTGLTLQTLRSKILIYRPIHFLQKLIKYQANSSCVIMSVILMTTLFYKALILQGEI